MEFEYNRSTLVIKDIKPFSLAQTLDCGQCFRWQENEDKSFTGVVHNRVVNAYEENKALVLEGLRKKDVDFFVEYFDLNRDYKKIQNKLKKLHPVLKDAASYASGIRILNQEPFEALISFIISQNNNIPRIKGIIDKLCENFGEKINGNYYSFPTSKTLASLKPNDLDIIKAGFRNRYIIDAATWVEEKRIDLESLRVKPYEEAKEELMQITGVGKKVADCTLLYGLHRLESFPLDVWMKRAMEVLFDNMDPSLFGDYGGIAQQYIFHYSRMHKELFQ